MISQRISVQLKHLAPKSAQFLESKILNMHPSDAPLQTAYQTCMSGATQIICFLSEAIKCICHPHQVNSLTLQNVNQLALNITYFLIHPSEYRE